MTDPVLRSAGVSPGATGTSCVIVKPVGLAVGDLMFAHVSAKELTTAIVAPANWTEVVQTTFTDRVRSALFWKFAVQDDVDATNFTFTTGSDSNLGAIAAIDGDIDTTTPIGAFSSKTNSYTGSQIVASTITPPVANSLMLILGSQRTIATVSNYAIATSNPASWTEAYDISTNLGSDTAIAMACASRPETTATGNGTATTSTGTYNIGFLVAISPAAGTTPVSDELQAIWNVRQAVSDTIQPVFNVRAVVSDTVQGIWHVRKTISDEIQAIWNVRAAISDELQAIWNIRFAVSDTVQGIWNVLSTASVSDTLQIIWHVRQAVSDEIQAKWNIRKTVSDSVQAIWHVRQAVSNTIQVIWNVAYTGLTTAVSSTLKIIWNVLCRSLKIVKTPLASGLNIESALSTGFTIESDLSSGLNITPDFVEK
jgi:hypothetical protein